MTFESDKTMLKPIIDALYGRNKKEQQPKFFTGYQRKYKNAVLCYIEGPWAFFTTQLLKNQWGDDWDDAPYEHNAGCLYGSDEGDWEIVKIAWDGPFITPNGGVMNSRYSVQSINRGDVAWLRQEGWHKGLACPIHAGTTLQEFRDRMISAGGMVYFPWEEYFSWEG